jgi:hypothetical protein
MAITPDGPIWMALTLLVGVVLLKYGGFVEKVRYGLGFLVASALFFFLEGATSMGFWTLGELSSAQAVLVVVWGAVAWVLLLLSAFIVATELTRTRR